MTHPELLAIGALRALAEVSMLFLVGQGVLALLAGRRRAGNPIYQVFVIVTRPVLKLARRISPPQIIDRHLPFVAFFFLFWLWLGLAWLKRTYCEAYMLQCF